MDIVEGCEKAQKLVKKMERKFAKKLVEEAALGHLNKKEEELCLSGGYLCQKGPQNNMEGKKSPFFSSNKGKSIKFLVNDENAC